MRRFLLRLFLAVVVFTFAALPRAHATWYSENIENGADIIMMDLRWPWWPSGTYYANWNTSFNPKPNNITFYAGFTGTLPDGPGFTPNPDEKLQDAFRPGSVWTFWGADKEGTPVRFTDVAPNLYIKNTYGGEGSSGTVGATPWQFVTQKRWYTMVGRVWKVDETHGCVARWIKDQADGKWHHVGTARLPIPATSFTGNSGFIEPLSNEKAVRSLHRRFGYFRKDGQWKKSDTISIDKTQYVVVNVLPEGDHEYVGVEYAQTPGLLPQRLTGAPISGDKKHSFTTKQPDAPTLDKPAVGNVKAESTGAQVVVSWEVPETASPAFGYRVEVFDNADCRGEPTAVKEERNPSARNALVDVKLPTPTVRLTVTDIFDQSAPAVVVKTSERVPVRAHETASAGRAGLRYTLVQKDSGQKSWQELGDLSQGRLIKQGIARGFDPGVKESLNSEYALSFSGRLRVPAAGLYIFHAQIDGAYRIQLMRDDLLVWDGQHGTSERAAVRRLEKGDYSIVVSHLFDHLPAQNFLIEWEGPGIARQTIPLDALIDDSPEKVPQLKIVCSADGDGTGSATVTAIPVDGTALPASKTVLYLGSLQLAESKGPELKFHGPLPRGENTLWARLTYDNNHTVDSDRVTLSVTGKPVDAAWTVRNVGDQKASAGLWQTGAQAFQFFGNGMHTVSQKITGDFTATCRIDTYAGSQGEPVNHHAWVGLTALEHGDRLNWDWGQHFHLVQTARDGLRASADFTDFGAGRMTSYSLPKDRPWLRIMRQGNIWTAWTSADGKAWELGAYQFKKAQPQMDVGLFFSALPQDARAHYSASVSEFRVQSGVAADSIPPQPVAAQGTSGERITGVVMARSDANVVVVRSTSGLLRTTDGGTTWSPANGALTDLAVRSVAIHPTDPLTMLRAGVAGLWKTTDGGMTWVRLNFDGDFDATGPSALCGEVIAFDLRNPQTIYVGCESRGAFKSTDGGATWSKLGADGERVTSVVVWPWEKYYPAPAKGKSQLCITTSPDRWMSLLGRGESAAKTTATTARSYVSNDDVKTISIADERVDTGFFNVAFDKAMQSVNEMRYATAHGYQTQVFSGSHMALYPEQKRLEWKRPFTAIAATAMGDQKFGRVIAQALDPVQKGRVSRSERWAFEWDWLSTKGDIPAGGLIAVCGDVHLGQKWWFVYTDGLYYSADGGTTFGRILSHTGKR